MTNELCRFIGQEDTVKQISIHVNAAMIQGRPLEHTILYGPPGLGKTTLSKLIHKEVGWRFIQRSGDEINKSNLWNILEQMEYRDIFFLDEIHNIPTKAAEILYGPMQEINDLVLSGIDIEKYSFEGRSLSMFTLIGATTSAGMLPRPLRDRFIHQYIMRLYSAQDLIRILMLHNCPKDVAQIIALRSKGTARIALNFFIGIRNLAQGKTIKAEHCFQMFQLRGIDKLGLNDQDRKILQYLESNTTAGIEELSYATNIDKDDIISMCEPYLLQLNLIKRTNKGRTITNKGKSYLSGD